jgi:predicted MPP superfamily phosphohydrolase
LNIVNPDIPVNLQISGPHCSSIMSLTYVIPDIHGRHDLLTEGLAEIAARGDASVIVMIGDYVDKGPDSKQVIDRLLSGVDGSRLVALKGNHDAMMVEALRDPSKMAAWIAKGGDAAWPPMAAILPTCRATTWHGSIGCN